MIKESNNFIVHYNEVDAYYIDESLEYLENNINRILDFFDVKLDNKITIRLIETKTKLDEMYEKNSLDKAYDWLIGYANIEENEIIKLSYRDYKSTYNKSDTLTDFKKTLNHEVVHIIHSKIIVNWPINLILEGVACYLSDQYDEVDLKEYTKEEVLGENSDYAIYKQVFKELLNIVPEEEMKQILKGIKKPNTYIEKVLSNIKKPMF